MDIIWIVCYSIIDWRILHSNRHAHIDNHLHICNIHWIHGDLECNTIIAHPTDVCDKRSEWNHCLWRYSRDDNTIRKHPILAGINRHPLRINQRLRWIHRHTQDASDVRLGKESKVIELITIIIIFNIILYSHTYLILQYNHVH